MNPDPGELAVLIERCAGGEGDETDWSRLRAVADPTLRSQIARDLRLTVRLHGLLHGPDPMLGSRVLSLVVAQRPSRRYRSFDAIRRRLRRRTARRWWPLATAALLLIGVGLLLRDPSPTAPYLLPEPDAVAHAGDTPVPMTGMRLEPGTNLDVRVGRVALRWNDGSTLHLDEGGRLHVVAAGAVKAVALATGRITAEVAPQIAGRSLRIDCPRARTEVVGTRFVVEAQPRRTVLEVSSGVVRFSARRGGDALLVAAGGSAEVVDDGEARWLHPRHQQELAQSIHVEVAGDGHVRQSAPHKVDNRNRSMQVRLEPDASSEIYLTFPVAQWRGRAQRSWLLLEMLDGPAAVELEIWEMSHDFDPNTLCWATRSQEGRRIGRMTCRGTGPQRADLGAVLATGSGDLVLRIASLTSGVEPTIIAAREHGDRQARPRLELELDPVDDR